MASHVEPYSSRHHDSQLPLFTKTTSVTKPTIPPKSALSALMSRARPRKSSSTTDSSETVDSSNSGYTTILPKPDERTRDQCGNYGSCVFHVRAGASNNSSRAAIAGSGACDEDSSGVDTDKRDAAERNQDESDSSDDDDDDEPNSSDSSSEFHSSDSSSELYESVDWVVCAEIERRIGADLERGPLCCYYERRDDAELERGLLDYDYEEARAEERMERLYSVCFGVLMGLIIALGVTCLVAAQGGSGHRRANWLGK